MRKSDWRGEGEDGAMRPYIKSYRVLLNGVWLVYSVLETDQKVGLASRADVLVAVSEKLCSHIAL